jgi:hypothetical protein
MSAFGAQFLQHQDLVGKASACSFSGAGSMRLFARGFQGNVAL